MRVALIEVGLPNLTSRIRRIVGGTILASNSFSPSIRLFIGGITSISNI